MNRNLLFFKYSPSEGAASYRYINDLLKFISSFNTVIIISVLVLFQVTQLSSIIFTTSLLNKLLLRSNTHSRFLVEARAFYSHYYSAWNYHYAWNYHDA